MRHVTLTCINHPNLRWHCKSIAVNEIGQYNGSRHIFFELDVNGLPAEECNCRGDMLRFAPEELERQKTQPLEG